MGKEVADSRRYRAFISYSHVDERIAKWLHRRLETYRIPSRLAGREGAHGPVPARLGPVFRDRVELSVAGDLSAEVKAALTASHCMVLLCSPAAAASTWVNREVELFRQIHPDRNIFPVIVEGTPDTAFPPALTANGNEPAAADFDPENDGRRLGFLKVAAGLAGVGLDALVQRDAQRRIRRVMAITGLAVVAMLVFAILLSFALSARREAERQRVEAEGLVEFMLTDLRDRLRGVGRLDVLTTVNERALSYYGGQPLDGLPADSLDRRARILQAMGEDDAERKDFKAASQKFEEAQRVTTALLKADPNNPERIYTHAQSQYWIGDLAHWQDHPEKMRAAYEEYRRLAARMVELEPDNARYRQELNFALSNLCAVEVMAQRDAALSEQLCLNSLEQAQTTFDEKPDDERALAVAVAHAWYADALVGAGKLEEAARQRVMQLELVADLREKNPSDRRWQENYARALLSNAELARRRGHAKEVAQFGRAGIRELTDLVKTDPENGEWDRLLRRLRQSLEQGE